MIRVVIFDLDGTLYRGEQPIEGAGAAVASLRAAGFRVLFLSNAGTNSRREMAEKLQRLGVKAAAEEIYSSAYGAARYVLEKYGNGATYYAVAEKSMHDELQSLGLVHSEQQPKAVIISLDRHVTYDKLAKAYLLVRAGAEFIATNKDPEYPVENGFLPGAGSVVAAVETPLGFPPVLIGKPSTMLIDWMLKDCNIKKSEVLIVGDALQTDIAVAKKAKIKSALVLTGIATKKDLEKERKLKPDMVLASVKQLPAMLGITP
ncbi:MAG: HAD-IIA family hydrolase [Candidatus Micrarchaeota archaeon]